MRCRRQAGGSPSRLSTSRAVCATRRLIAHADVTDAERDHGLTCERTTDHRGRRRGAAAGTRPEASPQASATLRVATGIARRTSSGRASVEDHLPLASFIIRATVRHPPGCRQCRSSAHSATRKPRSIGCALAAGAAGRRRPRRGTRTPHPGALPSGQRPRRDRSARRAGRRQRRHPRAGARAHDGAAARTGASPSCRRIRACANCSSSRCSLACSRWSTRSSRRRTAHDSVGSLRHRRRGAVVGLCPGRHRPDLAGPRPHRAR